MAISYSVYVAYAVLRMSTQDERVTMTSTLPWKMKIQYLLTLQVSRYCPLVLQSSNVAAVPIIEHRVCDTGIYLVYRRYTFGWPGTLPTFKI